MSINGQKMTELEEFLSRIDRQAEIPNYEYDNLDGSFASLRIIYLT